MPAPDSSPPIAYELSDEIHNSGFPERTVTLLIVKKVRLFILNKSLEFYGDMKVSSFKVIPRIATTSEISSWSSTCKPNITQSCEIMSMDDIVETGLAQIIIPSVCDDVDECANSPCGTHKCINIRGGFKCECEKGFTGSQCDILIDRCEQSLCQNNATCVMGNSNYSCQCPNGYSGAYCQVRAVDGAWSDWSGWTGCSKTCANGIQARTRRCDSPPPNAQGKDCNGNSTETRMCKMETCPECLPL
ncbi:delta-like protein 1 [Ruditapes philippinarum]|uniref:delta-like protein 1 n=1 Tax=Ruditapes philippinarum TaxID=129788 RepID=UPI00295C0A6E|nr:delta-like protein 1 [Ruditapes philippinarum]